MNNFEIGQRVEYVADDADDKFYPPKGTLGTITSAGGNLFVRRMGQRNIARFMDMLYI